MNEPFSNPNPDPESMTQDVSNMRKLTDKEKALLAEAKPQTEEEALSLLAALAKLEAETLAEETLAEETRPCVHIFMGKCQLRNVTVPNPLGCHCSRYK